MLELDYNERVTHDMKYIPLSFYHVDEKHARYHAPIHWHRPSEMARVLSGELKIHLNDRTVCAKTGDIIYINREVIHGFSPRKFDTQNPRKPYLAYFFCANLNFV